jgi:hypothetical protein
MNCKWHSNKASENGIVFHDDYLMGFIETSDYYEYPAYSSEPTYETNNVDEMMNFMLEGNKGYYRFYFKNPNKSNVHYGMIFFNQDNTLVLGLGYLLSSRNCILRN